MNGRRLLPWLLAAGAALPAQFALAQVLGTVKGFKIAEHYDPPHETQMKTLLEAATARPLSNGLYLLTEMHVQSFKVTGDPDLVVNTPECTYDSVQRFARSGGHLELHSGDGGFTLAGDGFLWQQTNSSVFVSNNVKTTVDPQLVAKSTATAPQGPPPQSGPVDINSDSFQYDSDTSLATYRGHVEVSGTNVNGASLGLKSGLLLLKLPRKERQLQEITAEQAVALDYSGVHATGERAVYEVDQALVHVTGHPEWQSEGRAGRGDEFLIDRNARVLRANGNGWLKLPAQSMGTNSFLGAASSNAPAGPRTLEVFCANYEVRTNAADFQRNVRVLQKAGETEQGQMTCDTMHVSFTGTNELQTLVAEKQVVIRDAERQFTAAKAVYTATNSTLELTGHPAWQAGAREGKGDVLRFDLKSDEMLADGNAAMKLPAEELGAAQVSSTGSTAPMPVSTNSSSFAEIFSDDYTVRRDRVVFTGGVYISHPRMVWSCETVEVQLPPQGGIGHKITAERSVYFELVDETGQKVQGKGEKAVYTYSVTGRKTNDWMELTGDPIVETTNGVFRNQVIIFDRMNHKLIAPGKYVIRGSAGAFAKTFKMPSNRWIK